MSVIIGSPNYLAVQKLAAIIVCKSCNIGIPSKRTARFHLTDKHAVGSIIAKTIAQRAEYEKEEVLRQPHPLRQVYESAPDPVEGSTSHGNTLYAPLEGIETTTGFRCTICPACFSSEKGMREHFSDFHKLNQLTVQERWNLCVQNGSIRIQTLFGGNKTRYFPVSASTPVGEVNTAPSSCAREHCSEETPAQASSQAPPQPRPSDERNYILESDKDVQHVFAEMDQAFSNTTNENGMPRSNMNAFLARTKFDVFLNNENISMDTAAKYSGLLENYTKEESEVVQDVSKYLLNVPNLVPEIAPSVLHDVNLRGSNEFTAVSKRAAERYARSFARIVISALRLDNHILLPPLVASALEKYLQVLRDLSINQAVRQDFLHALLKSICLHRLDKMDSPQALFVHNFISFATIIPKSRSQTDSFRFAQAKDISPLLAALLYGASSCAITEVRHLGVQSQILRENPSSDQAQANAARGLLKERLEDVLSCLEESQNSAASYIRKVLTIANTISRKEDVDFVFDECTTHRLCGIVNNVHITMSSLGGIVKATHKDIRSSFSSLLYGASLPEEFFSHLATFQDTLQEKSSGFSFLCSGQNKDKCRKYTVWLFNQITERRPVGIAEFSPSQSTPLAEVIQIFGKNVRRKAVQNWLSNLQDVQDKLLACTHISSGSPGRATELETLQLFNTEHALRNFYISQGRVCIVTRYSKIRTLVGWDRIIPRFPDPKTSDLFLTYLILFRNLECIFVRALFGIKAMKSHMEGLFVERGKNYIACRIRDIVRGHFHAHSIPIQFNHFRHFAAGMVPTITQNSPAFLREELITEARQIAHLQAGHSVEVAEHSYARKASDLPSLTTTAFTKYRMFSTEWHRNMGLLHDASPLPNHSIPKPFPSTPATDVQAIADSISGLISHKTKNRFSKLQSTLAGIKRALPPSQPTSSSKRPSREILCLPPQKDPELDIIDPLPALRDLLKNPNAIFTSNTQLQVAVAACEGRDDLMVLMPTGSGKTISVLLPAFLEESSSSTVIIVPVAALLQEHVDKSRTLGISVATWDNRHEDVQVYVISVDHTVEEIRNFLNYLQTKGKLRRLVIDEVHLLFLWQLFRASIQRLPYALKSRGHYTQVILLTATLPPHYRERLVKLLSLSSVVLYSQPSVRCNLRFNVIDTSAYAGSSNFVSHTQLMTDVLCEQVLNLCRSLLNNDGGRILIFALYKKEAEDLRSTVETFLRRNIRQSIQVLLYHAGMSSDELKAAYHSWKDSHPKLIVAVGTEAFGTGVDLPNVRGVFHFGGSNGILQYVQEAGRGGRDGKPAVCTVIYNKAYADKHSAKVMKQDQPKSFCSDEDEEDRKHEWMVMCNYMTQTVKCRKNHLFAHVDGTGPGMCLFDHASINCDVCEDYHRTSIVNERILASQPVSNLLSHSNGFQSTVSLPAPASLTMNPFHNTARPPSSYHPESFVPTATSASGQTYSSPEGPHPVRRRLSLSQSQGNSNNNSDNGNDIINQFRLRCHEFQNLCIDCVVYDENEEFSDHKCRHMRARCKRCFKSGHQLSQCRSFNPKRHNFCYRCSLSQVMGENVHKTGEFGGQCFMGLARDISWAFWTKDNASQEKIASSLFTSKELADFQSVFDNSTNDEELEDNKTKFYDEWLQKCRKGIPNLVLFFRWWCNIIHKA